MYIDPAAGSLVLQTLIAGLLTALATFKNARRAITRFVRGRNPRTRQN